MYGLSVVRALNKAYEKSLCGVRETISNVVIRDGVAWPRLQGTDQWLVVVQAKFITVDDPKQSLQVRRFIPGIIYAVRDRVAEIERFQAVRHLVSEPYLSRIGNSWPLLFFQVVKGLQRLEELAFLDHIPQS